MRVTMDNIYDYFERLSFVCHSSGRFHGWDMFTAGNFPWSIHLNTTIDEPRMAVYFGIPEETNPERLLMSGAKFLEIFGGAQNIQELTDMIGAQRAILFACGLLDQKAYYFD